ncbi:hypothetical protein [Dokdonella soli]|uniref:DUF3060 domain-containing protein n=1 Tax=Dokdonella soli TaxID=529810 RepID=A0ABP3U8R5_9GAMM
MQTPRSAAPAAGIRSTLRGIIPVLFLLATCAANAASVGQATSVGGNNEQVVVVKGAVINTATTGGTARINVGSVVNSRVGGSNKQHVVVGGAIVNSASGPGSKSEINIGSVSTGKE